MVRADRMDQVFRTMNEKHVAIIEDIKDCYQRGQPVLVGTISVEKSERLSGILKKMGVRHEVLNAKNHEREGEIIAQAGKKGRVTVATNLAGRGGLKVGGPGS